MRLDPVCRIPGSTRIDSPVATSGCFGTRLDPGSKAWNRPGVRGCARFDPESTCRCSIVDPEAAARPGIDARLCSIMFDYRLDARTARHSTPGSLDCRSPEPDNRGTGLVSTRARPGSMLLDDPEQPGFDPARRGSTARLDMVRCGSTRLDTRDSTRLDSPEPPERCHGTPGSTRLDSTRHPVLTPLDAARQPGSTRFDSIRHPDSTRFDSTRRGSTPGAARQAPKHQNPGTGLAEFDSMLRP